MLVFNFYFEGSYYYPTALVLIACESVDEIHAFQICLNSQYLILEVTKIIETQCLKLRK